MPKTLDDVKTFLEGQDGGIDYYEAVNAAILHERNTGKGLVSDVTRKLERYQNALKKAGWTDEQDLGEWTGKITESLQKGERSGKKLSDTEKRLGDLESTLAGEVKRRTELETKNKNNTIKDVLVKSFTSKDLINADLHSRMLIQENFVNLADDGKTVTWRDGDNQIDYDTGLNKYLERNRDSIMNRQRTGANGSSSNQTSSAKTMNRSAFDRLPMTERNTFLKEGGKLTD